jgi:cytochrome d ubiquinol oxidase subunit I
MKFAAMFDIARNIVRLQALDVQRYGPGNYVPVIPLAQAGFFVMIVLAFLMGVVALIGIILLLKDRIERQRWFLWMLLPLIAAPYLADISGWLLRETGRQPWVIQGVLKTSDALSPSLTFSTIAISLTAFTVAYVVLSAINGVLLWRAARRGLPDERDSKAEAGEEQENTFALS